MGKKIGQVLVDKKVLTAEQVQQILAHSQVTGISFGDAGAQLGLFSREQLVRALGPKFSADWFDLKPEFLPESTQAIFSPEEMIRYGVVGLGYKRRYGFFTRNRLNLGMVNPGSKSDLEEIKARLPKHQKEIKVYLVPADRFIDALEKVYGITRTSLQALEKEKVNSMLSLFLEPT